MARDPREGVDYLVDLYAVAQVDRAADPDAIQSEIRKRQFEYHPDRLQGLAPEFREKGERMAGLLNRASGILLDENKRREYDAILSEWRGPLSDDGTPVIDIGRAMQLGLHGETPDAVESAFSGLEQQVTSMSGHDPKRITFLERLLAAGSDDEELREQYEAALLAADVVLAISEHNRSELLGLPSIRDNQYRTAIGYSGSKAQAIEAARTGQLEQLKQQAIGSVATRLALLAGETPPNTDVVPASPAEVRLPDYYDAQTEKVQSIAEQREEILRKRLGNFRPAYPESDIQAELHMNAVAGMRFPANTEGEYLTRWFAIDYSPLNGTPNIDAINQDSELYKLVQEGDVPGLIEEGRSVLTFDTHENIEPVELLVEAARKHFNNYLDYKRTRHTDTQ